MDLTAHPKNPNKAIATYANLEEEFVFYRMGLPMSRPAAYRTLLSFNLRSMFVDGSYYPHQIPVKIKDLQIAESTLENRKEAFSETDNLEDVDANEATLQSAYHEVLETIGSFLMEHAPDSNE